MGILKPSDRLEIAVMRSLSKHVSRKEIRVALLAGNFESYQQAEKLRSAASYEGSPSVYAYDYLCTSLLSKWKGWSTGSELSEVALRSWSAAESKCASTNRAIRDLRLRGKDPRVLHFISEVQRKIDLVLGPFRLFEATRRSRWSNGATLLTKRGATVHQKMTEPLAVSARALPYLRNEIAHDPHWFHALTGRYPDGPVSLLPSVFEVREDNRWLTVPKNAKTDRCIAAEPAGNAFLQQGVGRYIRDRLKRFGVDLDDQSINQRLCREALARSLATLDLSAASDSISLELVWLLLPPAWACYLDDLRCKYSSFPDGSKVRLEKFSSMGNAYTFELESLLFWAIADTANVCGSDRVVSVYGDDIIVNAEASDALTEWLEFFGFSVNRDKSFTAGAFYESCGLHCFLGIDVTPVYQKEVVNGNHDLVRFANRLIRWQAKHEDFLTDEQNTALLCAISMIMIHHRGRVPLVPQGDDGYNAPRSALGRYCANRGYHCDVLRFVPKTRDDNVILVDGFGIARCTGTSYLSQKLRDPAVLNNSPQGRVEVTAMGGMWCLSKAWIMPDWNTYTSVYV